MANRRMFSKTIVASSRFLRMPMSSRLLYFDLGMNADDDGYCEWYPVLQMTGAKEQDLQVLQANDFVQVFDTNVLVIRDWKENNQIRMDRYQVSKYVEKYRDNLGLPNGNQVATNGKPSIGKDRIGKVKDNAVAIAPAVAEPFKWEEYRQKMLNDSRGHIRLIAYFLLKKKKTFASADEVSEAIARHSRYAVKVAKFEKEKILEVMNRCDEQFNSASPDRRIDWTLETCWKMLTK